MTTPAPAASTATLTPMNVTPTPKTMTPILTLTPKNVAPTLTPTTTPMNVTPTPKTMTPNMTPMKLFDQQTRLPNSNQSQPAASDSSAVDSSAIVSKLDEILQFQKNEQKIYVLKVDGRKMGEAIVEHGIQQN
jgi:cytoskeletal protein RodZ